MSASGTITALRAKVKEQEEEIHRLKRELAKRPAGLGGSDDSAAVVVGSGAASSGADLAASPTGGAVAAGRAVGPRATPVAVAPMRAIYNRKPVPTHESQQIPHGPSCQCLGCRAR